MNPSKNQKKINKNGKSSGSKKMINPDLIPAIIQDFKSGEVLMLAYMSRDSLLRSIDTKTTWFWSRSRKELWNKGAKSGNKQHIKEIKYDCDSDALLIKVEQEGVACHTGNKSCFFNDTAISSRSKKKLMEELKFFINADSGSAILEKLYETVTERIASQKQGSYTYSLHQKGIDEILKKIGEESIEVILSSKHQSRQRIISEIADLLYHLIVLLSEKKIKLENIYLELESRRK